MKNLILYNGTDAHLSTWPTSPKEQKGTPEITFLVSPAKDPKPGDILQARKPLDGQPGVFWILEEITEARPAKMTGYNFIKAKAKRQTAADASLLKL